jgi:hypothetical protein
VLKVPALPLRSLAVTMATRNCQANVLQAQLDTVQFVATVSRAKAMRDGGTCCCSRRMYCRERKAAEKTPRRFYFTETISESYGKHDPKYDTPDTTGVFATCTRNYERMNRSAYRLIQETCDRRDGDACTRSARTARTETASYFSIDDSHVLFYGSICATASLEATTNRRSPNC